MKILTNGYNDFSDLDEAKKFYMPDIPDGYDEEEDYSDEDPWSEYLNDYRKYVNEIQQANSLDELADVLNRYTNIFEEGRYHKVI